jgi:hypothetical protein
MAKPKEDESEAEEQAESRFYRHPATVLEAEHLAHHFGQISRIVDVRFQCRPEDAGQPEVACNEYQANPKQEHPRLHRHPWQSVEPAPYRADVMPFDTTHLWQSIEIVRHTLFPDPIWQLSSLDHPFHVLASSRALLSAPTLVHQTRTKEFTSVGSVVSQGRLSQQAVQPAPLS